MAVHESPVVNDEIEVSEEQHAAESGKTAVTGPGELKLGDGQLHDRRQEAATVAPSTESQVKMPENASESMHDESESASESMHDESESNLIEHPKEQDSEENAENIVREQRQIPTIRASELMSGVSTGRIGDVNRSHDLDYGRHEAIKEEAREYFGFDDEYIVPSEDSDATASPTPPNTADPADHASEKPDNNAKSQDEKTIVTGAKRSLGSAIGGLLARPKKITIFNSSARQVRRIDREYKKAAKSAKKAAKSSMSRKSNVVPSSNNLIGYLAAEPFSNLGIRDVSIGSEIILAAVRQPGNQLLERINGNMADAMEKKPNCFFGVVGDRTSFSTDEFLSDNPPIKDLIAIMSKINIEVVVAKSPVSESESDQRRVLKIHEGQGIRISPYCAKSFNADFDGDQATIHLGKDIERFHPMDAIVAVLRGTKGSGHLDVDYLPEPVGNIEVIRAIAKGRVADRAKRIDKKIYREVFANNNETMSWFIDQQIDDIINAYIDIFGENQDEALKKFGEGIINLRYNTEQNGDVVSEDFPLRYKAAIFDAILGAMREISLQARFTTAFSDTPAFASEDSGFSWNKAYKAPKSMSAPEYMDRYNQFILDSATQGTLPPSFDEYCIEMCRHIGDIEGQSPMFRAAQNSGKLAKRACETYFGKDFVRNVNGIRSQATALAMASLSDGSAETIRWSSMRREIIMNVGYPKNYSTAQEFRDAFVREYNMWRLLMYNSNIALLNNMALFDNHFEARTISDGDTFDSQFVKAFIDIYGDFTMEFLFGDFVGFDQNPAKAQKMAAKLPEAIFGDVVRENWKYGGNDRWIMQSRYATWSLRKFAAMNKASTTGIMPIGSNGPRSVKFSVNLSSVVDSDSTATVNTDRRQWFGLLLAAVADSKTGTWSQYNKDLIGENGHEGNLQKQFRVLQEIRDSYANFESGNSQKWEQQTIDSNMDKMVELIFLSNTKLFSYFGMTSFNKFVESDYGKMMLSANSVQELGGIRLAMIAEMRLGRLNGLCSSVDPDSSKEERDAVYEAIIAEENRLAASSDLWRAVMLDHYGPTENQIMALGMTAEQFLSKSNPYGYCWKAFLHCTKNHFKENQKIGALASIGHHEGKYRMTEDDAAILAMGGYEKWPSAQDFLLDPTIEYTAKSNILSDFCIVMLGDMSTPSYAIPYQIDSDYASTVDGANVVTANPYEEAMYRASNEGLESLHGRMRKQRERQALKNSKPNETKPKFWRTSPDSEVDGMEDLLLSMVKAAVRGDIGAFNIIDKSIFIDAMSAIWDASYSSTEKAKAEPAVEAVAKALGWQRNGGYTSDVWRIFDRDLGFISERDLTRTDVIMAACGKLDVIVYGTDGSAWPLNISEILGEEYDNEDITEEDITNGLLDYFQDHPAVSKLFSVAKAYQVPGYDKKEEEDEATHGDIDTFSVDDALFSFASGENVNKREPWLSFNNSWYNTSFRALSDMPEFHALASLIIPRSGVGSMVASSKIDDAYKKILYIAASVKQAKEAGLEISGEQPANTVIGKMQSITSKFFESKNWTAEALENLGVLDGTFDLEDIPQEGLVSIDKELYPMPEAIMMIISKMSDRITLPSDKAALDFIKEGFPETDIEIDDVSIASFFSVRSTLARAKIPITTGVEGGEDNKTQASWVWINSFNDTFVEDEAEDGSKTIRYASEGEGRDSNGLNAVQLFYSDKRSYSSEAGNLKAAKTGDDGKMSITKHSRFLDSKERSDLVDVINKVESMYDGSDESYLECCLEFGKYIKKRDALLDFKTMSDSQYASLASVMLRRKDNIETGESILDIVSLSQITACINDNLGYAIMGVNLRSKGAADTVAEASNGIVESITGLSLARSLDPDTLEKRIVSSAHVDSFMPAALQDVPGLIERKYGAIRQRSSSADRNMALLQKLAMKGRDERGRVIWKSDVMFLDRRQKDNILNRITAMLINDKESSFDDMVSSISSAGYAVVAYMSSRNGRSVMPCKATTVSMKEASKVSYDTSVKGVPGPANVVFVEDQKSFDDAFAYAEKYGMTLMFPSSLDLSPNQANLIKDRYVDFPIDERIAVIPMFDEKLNGSKEKRSGYAFYNPDNVTRFWEDEFNIYSLGDASIALTKYADASITVFDRGTKSNGKAFSIDAEHLFADTLSSIEAQYGSSARVLEYSIVDEDEIMSQIVNNDSIPPTDLMISDSNPNYEKLVGAHLNRLKMFKSFYSGGTHVGTARPNQIVAWAKCDIAIENESNMFTVYAPIVPFQVSNDSKSRGVPLSYSVDSVKLIQSKFIVEWTNNAIEKSIKKLVKIFEGTIGANKQIYAGDPIDDITLDDGNMITGVLAAASVKNRILGADKRAESMYTLMFEARTSPWGYNFGDVDNAFCGYMIGNELLSDAIKTRRISESEWQSIMSDPSFRFLPQDMDGLNEFIYDQCNKCLEIGVNPSDFLTSGIYIDNQLVNYHNLFEFKMLFESSPNYQDMLLKYMHIVTGGKICQYGLSGAYGRTYRGGNIKPLFRLDKHGVLRRRVPVYTDKDGKITYRWQFVRTSLGFMSEDDASRMSVSLNGATRLAQEIQSAIRHGKRVSRRDFEAFMKMALVSAPNGIEDKVKIVLS